MKSPARSLWVMLALALIGSAGCGDNRSDEQRLADAVASVEAGNFRAAMVDVNVLLQRNPVNHAARLTRAAAWLALGDPLAAEKDLLQAQARGADPRDYTEALARALLGRKAFVDVLARIEADVYTDPAGRAVIEALHGYALLGLDSVDDAREAFAGIVASEPGAEAVRLALLGQAELARRDKDLATAEALARRSLDIAPESPDSHLALGQLLNLQQKFVAAEAVFARGLALPLQNAMHALLLQAGLAEALLGQGKIEQAAARVSALTVIRPEPPVSGYIRGRVALESGDINTAVARFQDVLSRFPDYQAAQTMLGAASLYRGDLELAQFWLLAALASEPNSVTARALLARTRLRMQRPEEALATLNEGLLRDTDSPELLAMRGLTSAALGDRTAGIAFLERSLAAIPSLQTTLALASVHSAVGDPRRAAALIQSLPADALDSGRRRVLMMMTRFDRNDAADSLTKVEALVEQYPADATILLFAGSLYLQSGGYDRARRYFDRVVQIEPHNRGALLNLSRIDQLEGNPGASKRRFEAYLQAHPDDLVALLALTQIAAVNADTQRAIELLTRASDLHPEALIPRVGLAGLALQSGDTAAAALHAAAAVQAHPNDAAAHYAMGLCHLLAPEPLAAVTSLQRAVDLRPDAHVYRDYLARAQAGAGQDDAARANFVAALQLEPGYLPAAVALARLDIHGGRLDEAAELVARLANSHPDHPDAIEVAGDLHAARANFAQAIAAYEAAQSLRPRSALAIKTYAVRSHTSMAGAPDTLREWLESHPEDIPARIILAQHYQGTRHRNQAIDQYETILTLQPANALALNNLAWIFFETPGSRARARALALARSAHEIMPANQQIADTYGWILVKSGHVADGLSVLQNALGRDDPSSAPDLAYHLAAALQETGDRDEARLLLRAALATKKPFPERDHAQALQDSL